MRPTERGGSRICVALQPEPFVLELCGSLHELGFDVVRAPPSVPARQLISHRPAVVLMDISPQYRETVSRAITELRERERRLPLILLGTDDSASAVLGALRLGAKDFFRLPCSAPEVAARVRTLSAAPAGRLAAAHEKFAAPTRGPLMVGNSSAVKRIKLLISSVAAHDCTVLITGETGTGKELAAQMIHTDSPRRVRPFVHVNCPALPDTLLENELFGHERGAFTGADGHSEGKLAAAAGGTVFFDEVGDMSLTGQAKILRATETRQFCRLGGHRPLTLDVRFVAATNANLEMLVAEGRFRRDLFYRIDVSRVHLPPLRERREDIWPLLEYFVHDFRQRYHRDLRFSSEMVARLVEYDWPGNIRELRNLVEAAFASTRPGLERIHELPSQFERRLESTRDSERRRVLTALRDCNFNKSKAAQQLRWSRMTLYRWLSKYGEAVPVKGEEEGDDD